MTKQIPYTVHVKTFEDIAKSAKAEIFFSGAHGGLVTYDGKGGPMIKEGGPMDRIFLLTRQGELGGNIGLDITHGNIRIASGSLAEDVELSRQEPTTVKFTFERNSDDKAIEIKGGIPDLNLPIHTVLFHASVEESVMHWLVGDDKSPGGLPYTAYHTKNFLHPAILERFELPNAKVLGAVTAWCKGTPREMVYRKADKQGAEFRTQQHLGCLRVFIG